jgi:hypothetical protein
MSCSALSFGSPRSSRASASSSSGSSERGRVPAIGRFSARPSRTDTRRSGEEPIKRQAVGLEEEHVRRGVRQAQHAVERERIASKRCSKRCESTPWKISPCAIAVRSDSTPRSKARLGAGTNSPSSRRSPLATTPVAERVRRDRVDAFLGGGDAVRRPRHDEHALRRVVDGYDVAVEIERRVGHVPRVARGARDASARATTPTRSEPADPASEERRQPGRGDVAEGTRGLAQLAVHCVPALPPEARDRIDADERVAREPHRAFDGLEEARVVPRRAQREEDAHGRRQVRGPHRVGEARARGEVGVRSLERRVHGVVRA